MVSPDSSGSASPMRGNPTQSRILDSPLWSVSLPNSRQWKSGFLVSGIWIPDSNRLQDP